VGKWGDGNGKWPSTVRGAHRSIGPQEYLLWPCFFFPTRFREQIDFHRVNSAVMNRLLEIWSDSSYVKKKRFVGQTALLDALFCPHCGMLTVGDFSDSVLSHQRRW